MIAPEDALRCGRGNGVKCRKSSSSAATGRRSESLDVIRRIISELSGNGESELIVRHAENIPWGIRHARANIPASGGIQKSGPSAAATRTARRSAITCSVPVVGHSCDRTLSECAASLHGQETSRIRGLQHSLAARSEMAIASGLQLRKRTAAHLSAMAGNREYLVTRYGPEMTATISQINRLTATLDEVANKVSAMKAVANKARV